MVSSKMMSVIKVVIKPSLVLRILTVHLGYAGARAERI
jgi:hypothetical protein